MVHRGTTSGPVLNGSTAPNSRAILGIIFVASILIGLNATMLSIALPSAVADLGASAVEGTWMLLAYMLLNGSTMVLAGQVADLFNLRLVFLSGFCVFGISSWMLTAPISPLAFIVARALQGVGSSMLLSTAAAMIVLVYPGRSLSKAMGIYLAGFAVANAAGPTVGGVITSTLSWRAMFSITGSIAVIALVVGWRVLRALPERVSTTSTPASAAVDWRGNGLIFLGVSGLLYGLSRAQSVGWASIEVLGPVLFGLLALAALVMVEGRVTHPAIDVALLRSKAFLAANLAGFFLVVPRMVITIILSLYFQSVLGDGPATAALKVTALPVGVALGSVLGGRFGASGRDRWSLGYAVLTLCGVAILWSAFRTGAGLTVFTIGEAIVGVACGAISTLNGTSILHQAPLSKAGSVNGVRTTFQASGSALGTSLMISLVVGGLVPEQSDRFLGGHHAALSATSIDLLIDNYLLAFEVMAVLVVAAVWASLILLRSGAGEVSDVERAQPGRLRPTADCAETCTPKP